LFASGEQGGYWDASDLTQQFQDSGGTTGAAVGSPVGKINDKSGRANHISQATSSARPILRQDGSSFYYWEFDGLDDRIGKSASSSDLAITGDMTVAVATQGPAGSTFEVLISCQTAAGTNNSYEFRFANVATRTTQFLMADGSALQNAAGTTALNNGKGVVDVRRGGGSLKLATNGNGNVVAQTVTPTTGATPVFWLGGRVDGLVLTGAIYQAFVINRSLSDAEIALLRSFLGQKQGITI
jgi:hypothetical protein